MGITDRCIKGAVTLVQIRGHLVEPVSKDQEAEALIEAVVQRRLPALRRHPKIPVKEPLCRSAGLPAKFPDNGSNHLCDHRLGLQRHNVALNGCHFRYVKSSPFQEFEDSSGPIWSLPKIGQFMRIGIIHNPVVGSHDQTGGRVDQTGKFFKGDIRLPF
jgi:hypothetical protein